MLKGSDGKDCVAKTVFISTLCIFLLKTIVAGITIGDIAFAQVDLTGMATFLCPLAAVYYGRSHTKANA